MIGRQLTHYKILELLGSGGMGQVFKARDVHLERFVAIKVLPPDKLTDPDRRERFFLEAKAASALNHPNIVTVYEAATEDETDFLVMEHVEGKTLDQLLRKKRLPVRLVIQYAIEIADALNAAHAAGIIHRDIKPSNLMISAEGRVKVLDFGLAKLVTQLLSSDETTLELSPQTAVGVVIGTPNYMSPEQAEGKALDKRTDVFSFGAVLYEMCTGRPAFCGDSTSAVIAAVLTQEPIAIDQTASEIPLELRRLVTRCLRKDQNRRFQDMLDVKLTLQEVQADFTSPKAISERTQLSRRSSWFWWTIAALASASIVLGFLWFWMSAEKRAPSLISPQQFTFDRGLTTTPAISPDGNLIAYASDRAGKGDLDIWVQYRNGSPVQVTRDQADEDEVSFSPDGTEIVFRSSKNEGGIYVAPSLGSGEPRLLASGNYYRPRFSPDGALLLIENPHPGIPKSYILNVDDSGGALREICPDFYQSSAAWSPDGTQILFTGYNDSEKGVFVIPRDGGTPRQIDLEGVLPENLPHLLSIDQWLADDRVLINVSIAGQPQLWMAQLHRNPWRLGLAGPLTLGTGTATGASVSRDGSLVFSNEERESDLWNLPYDSGAARVTGEARRLTQDSLDEQYPSITPNGELLAFSIANDLHWAAWLMDMKTRESRPVTGKLGARGYRPVISPDGTRLAFTIVDSKGTYVISSIGGAVRKISFGSPFVWSWTSDNHALFQLRSSASIGLTLVDVERGKEIGSMQRAQNLFQVHMSHDGKWLMAMFGGEVFIAPVKGDEFPAEDQWRTLGLRDLDVIRWSPDDNSILFISDRDSFRCIYGQRLEPRTKRLIGDSFPIAHFHQAARSLRIPDSGAIGLAVARDKIVVADIERSGNIWTAKLAQ